MNSIERLAKGFKLNGPVQAVAMKASGGRTSGDGRDCDTCHSTSAAGDKTQLYDPNRDVLEEKLRRQNPSIPSSIAGTTEARVLNQLNAFRVIHDAVKRDGHMVHVLPCVGYVDHGFFAYNAASYFSISPDTMITSWSASKYQGPNQGKDLYSIVRDYEANISAFVGNARSSGHSACYFRAPDIAAFVVFRKKRRMRAFCTRWKLVHLWAKLR
jgi:hypothetical protein